MRYTFKQFREEYPDDQACLLAVLENRYGNTCPRCGVVGVKWHPITGRKGFVCSACDRHIYPLADTIFRKSETSLWSWFYAIYQFSVSKNGVSAKELERSLGVTYKTAWRMCKQIRLLMEQDDDQLTGVVEIDETYHGARFKKGAKRGRGAEHKVPIVGAAERNGRVRAIVTSDTKKTTVTPFVRAYVDIDAVINTDEYRSYRELARIGYNHRTVNHAKKQYAVGEDYTNTIEGFWSQLKNSIRGTYHMVSPKYLQTYVNEFAFRYNFREVPIYPVLLERAAKLS